LPYFIAESFAPANDVGIAPLACCRSEPVGFGGPRGSAVGTGFRGMWSEAEVEGCVGERGGKGEEVEGCVAVRGGSSGLIAAALCSASTGSSSTVGRGGCCARAEVAVSVYFGGGDVGVGFDSSAIFSVSLVRLCEDAQGGLGVNEC
jgi:hypothetical protein